MRLIFLCFIVQLIGNYYGLKAQVQTSVRATIAISPELKEVYKPGGRLILFITANPIDTVKLLGSGGITLATTPKDWDVSKPLSIDIDKDEVDVFGKETQISEDKRYNILLIYRQNFDESQYIAEGNLFCKIDSVRLAPEISLILNLNRITKPLHVIDNSFVKQVVVKSKILTNWRGRPTFLKAGILLPSGFYKNPEARYPVCYSFPGLTSRFTKVNGFVTSKRFSEWWFSGEAPQIIYVIVDSEGPFGNTYQVDSENNGPCGRAFTEELIPEIEKQLRGDSNQSMRFLTGCSTGGWIAFALQIYYPDFFNGTWAYSPDPLDFEHFGLINIYSDKTVFYNKYGYLQPDSRTVYGEPTLSMQKKVEIENMTGKTGGLSNCYSTSGGAFGAYNAVYSSRGKDGLPSLMFDPLDGTIDHSIVKHWEKYDLKKFIENNWGELGPKLQGKIWVWSGDMDRLYSNVAARFVKDFFEGTVNPHSDAKFYFTPMGEHCSEFDDREVLLKVEEKVKHLTK